MPPSHPHLGAAWLLRSGGTDALAAPGRCGVGPSPLCSARELPLVRVLPGISSARSGWDRIGLGPTDPIAEEVVRGALGSIVWAVWPTLLVFAFLATRVDHPGAMAAALTILLAGTALGTLAIRWWYRPPRRAHAAAALTIAILQLSIVAELWWVPEPALAPLQVVLAAGTAFFLIDLRWMLAVQAFGLVCWLGVTAGFEPTPQWQLARLVTFAGWGAAFVFYVGRVSSMEQIRRLSRRSRELGETARKSADALQASEARLRDAQRIAHVGSYEWDLVADELHWSDELYRMFGWEPGEVPIDTALFLERVHPEDRQRLGDAVAGSLRGEAPVELEYRMTRMDGSERVVTGRSETDFDADGRPIRHTGTCLDITEHHRTEKALRASEERLMAILTAMDAERAVVVTREGVVESILGGSPPDPGPYGIRRHDVEGRSLHHFVPGEAGDRVLEQVHQVYGTGERGEVEASVDFPGGTFHFDVSLRALRAASGEIESVLAIVRDMTQQKADALALRQAQKLESLGVLAGGVAHDYNNLLVGILGNAEIALDGLDERSPLRPLIEDILQASTRAAELTQELLACAGTAKVEPEPVDLSAVVRETAQLVRPLLGNGIELELELAPEPVWAQADATQIRQVVMNFLTNAADATEGGAGVVRIRTGVAQLDWPALGRCAVQGTHGPGEYCRIEVSDRGVGMDRATIDRVFDPFFTTKFQGRGLGLASTMGIVRAHGGAVDVESAPGHGSTFALLLPRTAPLKEQPAPPEREPDPGSAAVLIVEDEALVRASTRRMLESQGYRVLETSSGAEAIDLVEGGAAPDLALVDLTMPDMDGEATFAALRARLPGVPVLFMSGHSDGQVALRVVGKERTAQIAKPFRTRELCRTVEDLLGAARPGRAD